MTRADGSTVVAERRPGKKKSAERPSHPVAFVADLFVRSDGRASRLPTGRAADLRRMDHENPGRHAGSLFGALEMAGLSKRLGGPDAGYAPDASRRWATVVRAVALLSGASGKPAHSAAVELGAALREAGYAEGRLVRLLASHDRTLRDGAVRAARFLASRHGGPVDLGPLVDLVLYDGLKGWTERAERARLRIARGFYASPKPSSDAHEGTPSSDATH